MDIRETTERILRGCIIPSSSGVAMYTPDGMGNYAALWTRDFFYMVDDAGELIPLEDIKNGIQYLLDALREDGWAPDRVDRHGTPFYTAGNGNFPASPNLDNGCFLCLLADRYLGRLSPDEAEAQFKVWQTDLCRTLDCLPTAEDGTIHNVATPPHSGYGFTDTVCKTGKLCFETLLLWQAKRAMTVWLGRISADATRYEADCRAIEGAFEGLFLTEDGTLRAATECCDQTDIWAMCYAVSIGFPLSKAVDYRFADHLAKHYDSITQDGQLRHLPADTFWERTFIPVPHGEYQNGAFWATPLRWLYDALAPYHLTLAEHAVGEALHYFETQGIFECINGDYRKLDTYVASATAVYAACKRSDRYRP